MCQKMQSRTSRRAISTQFLRIEGHTLSDFCMRRTVLTIVLAITRA